MLKNTTLRALLTTAILMFMLFQYTLYTSADSLYSYPSSGYDDSSYGTFSWSDVSYITASDTNYATSNIGDGSTHYLKATGFDFSSVPDTATIDGIQVEIQRYKSGNGGDIKDAVVQLLKAGSTVGNSKADTVNAWPTTDTWKTYGGSSDLWGTTWTASDIKNSNFGVVLSAGASNSEQLDEQCTTGTSSAQIYSVRYCGQDFKVDVDTLTKIDLYVDKNGVPPNDLYLRVRKDSMTGDILTSTSVPQSDIPSTPDWVTFDFDDIDVSSLSKVYIEVYTSSGDSTNCYRWFFSTSNPYADGIFHCSSNSGGSWNDYPNYDAQFKSYGYDTSIANVNAFKITVYYTAVTNTPPTVTNPSPVNASTGVSLQPTCHIDVSDAEGNTMNISWYENTTGTWILQQTNSSITNGTYYWTFDNATSYNTVYYWKVVVDDGTDTTTEIYHFTTKSNTPPSISNVYPSNSSTGIDLQPTCHVYVSDGDGDSLTVYWYENTTGQSNWILQQTNNTNDGTVYWQYTNASSYDTLYYWKVVVTDGTNTTVGIYHFKTRAVTILDTASFGGKTTVSNTPPELTSPSVTPSTGVDSYTTFYFNITWSDVDGDDPTDGYLKVNISKTGWYTNVSMTWISGDNTTGALYSYSTTLTAGSYTYQFLSLIHI